MKVKYGKQIIVKTGQYENQRINLEVESDELKDGVTMQQAFDVLSKQVNTELARQVLQIRGQDINKSRERSKAHAKAVLDGFGLGGYIDDVGDLPF